MGCTGVETGGSETGAANRRNRVDERRLVNRGRVDCGESTAARRLGLGLHRNVVDSHGLASAVVRVAALQRREASAVERRS